jgi:hypothetical protein
VLCAAGGVGQRESVQGCPRQVRLLGSKAHVNGKRVDGTYLGGVRVQWWYLLVTVLGHLLHGLPCLLAQPRCR